MGRNQIKTCPLCGKPTTSENNQFTPFCSERCKLIDLGQWASGKYRIPGEKVQAEEPTGEEEKTNHRECGDDKKHS